MQGGGQFYSAQTSADLDYVQQRASEEVEAARRAGRPRRHRPRHRHGHFNWPHLGRHKQQTRREPHAHRADPTAIRGPGRGESHGY